MPSLIFSWVIHSYKSKKAPRCLGYIGITLPRCVRFEDTLIEHTLDIQSPCSSHTEREDCCERKTLKSEPHEMAFRGSFISLQKVWLYV